MLSRQASLFSLWSSRNKSRFRGWLVVQFVTEFSHLAGIAREDGSCLCHAASPLSPSLSFSLFLSLFWNNYRFIGRFTRPRPWIPWPFKFSGCSSNNCDIVYTKTATDYCSVARARRGCGPYNLHWPFTDFGQIREDSGCDAGNLLQFSLLILVFFHFSLFFFFFVCTNEGVF